MQAPDLLVQTSLQEPGTYANWKNDTWCFNLLIGRFYQILQKIAYFILGSSVSFGILSIFKSLGQVRAFSLRQQLPSPGRDRQALDEEITKLNKDGFDAQLEGF